MATTLPLQRQPEEALQPAGRAQEGPSLRHSPTAPALGRLPPAPPGPPATASAFEAHAGGQQLMDRHGGLPEHCSTPHKQQGVCGVDDAWDPISV